MASRRSPKPPPAEIFPSASRRAHRPISPKKVSVVKDFLVCRRRVLRRLQTKSSLMVLTSEILGVQHETNEKVAL